MRSGEFPLEIALAVALGVVMFFSIGIAETVVTPEPVYEHTPVPARTEGLQVSIEPESPPEGVTPSVYLESDLLATRNLFRASVNIDPVVIEEETVVTAFVPPDPVEPSPPEPSPEQPPPEPEPELNVQGLVMSENRQAVVLNVDGHVHILTSDRHLPSGPNLVKVEDNMLLVEYDGREYSLPFEE